MATFNSTISGSDTGDTLIGTESDQLISAGTGADSIGSKYASSSLVGSDGNDTFFANTKVPGVGVGSTLVGGSGTAFRSAIPSQAHTSSPTAAMTLLMSLLVLKTLSCMQVREMTVSPLQEPLLVPPWLVVVDQTF